jgi:polyisoprenoid-binding protein YceI
MKTRHIISLLALAIASTAAVRQETVTAEVAVGKSIAANMPVDTAASFAADVGTVVGWSRITGAAAGSKITHVWIHNADTSKVELNVGGSPWRTYSRKTIGSDGAGDWTLQVQDADGKVLATKTFKIG